MNAKIECIFCLSPIEPELTYEEEADLYLFQCDNPICGAIYKSKTKYININVYHIPRTDSINLLRNDEAEVQPNEL